MNRKCVCCMPTCESLGKGSKFFQVPDNFRTCPKWLSVLSDLECIDESSLICAVCVRRFCTSHSLMKGDGQVVAVDCKALSDLFLGSKANVTYEPDKIKRKTYYPVYMFDMTDRDSILADNNLSNSDDFIRNFDTLKCKAYENLRGYNTGWTLNVFQNFLVFFYMNEDKIKSTITVCRVS